MKCLRVPRFWRYHSPPITLLFSTNLFALSSMIYMIRAMRFYVSIQYTCTLGANLVLWAASVEHGHINLHNCTPPKAWFPYDSSGSPQSLQIMLRGDQDDYMETLPRRLLTTQVTQTTSIVRIELSYIRTIEVVSVAPVVSDRLGSVSM